MTTPRRTPATAQAALPDPLDARDLRRGGSWTSWQRRKNTAIYHSLRGALFGADRLPEAVLLEAGRFVGHTTYLLSRKLRNRARSRAAQWAGPSNAQSLARASFLHAGENLCLCLLLRRPDVLASRFVTLSNDAERTLCGAVAEGRGVVFVSAHLGPFELISARVAELGLAPAVVVRESYDPRLDPLVDAHRLGRGIQVIHRGKPGASFAILRALRRCQPVGFLIDLPSRVRSMSTPFLGAPAMIPVGPQRICQMTGARLLVGTLRRQLEAHADRPRFELHVTRVSGNNEVELTRRVSQILQQDVLTRPEDWPWMA